MWYDFDIIKYAQYVLRPSLRKRKIFAIISIFLLPLIFIYTLFKSYRKQAINKLNINGQVIYIEKVLNDRFFLKNREIYITDIAGKESYIPSFLSTYENEIKNLIDYYKPAGRTYVLKIYEYE